MNDFELMFRLTQDYEDTVQHLLKSLNEQFSIVNPVRATFDKLISRKGKLKDGTIYQVHGIGVYFGTPDEKGIVDADLDVKGNYAGFDARRLGLFAKTRSAYSSIDESQIKQFLEEMTRQGKLQKRSEIATSHLYHWVVV